MYKKEYEETFLINKSDRSMACFCDSTDKNDRENRMVFEVSEQSDTDYLENYIFPILVPAIEETLREAHKWNTLTEQRCQFNGLDFIAEILWNRNPRRKRCSWLRVFDIPHFKLFLRMSPRPLYPKSWIWSEDEAAVILQKYIRGWLVRNRDECREMRNFWMGMKMEKDIFE